MQKAVAMVEVAPVFGAQLSRSGRRTYFSLCRGQKGRGFLLDVRPIGVTFILAERGKIAGNWSSFLDRVKAGFGK